MITQEELKELIEYKPCGSLFWIKDVGDGIKAGSKAGTKKPNSNGYLRVGINNTLYSVHRIVYLFHCGYFPENNIDHINKDKLDNRIENLREVSHTCNMRNTGNHKDNKSGVKGVSWVTSRNLWMSSIRVFNKSKFLGTYKSFEEAVYVRLAAEQCLGWEGCDSSSPAYRYIKGL